MTPEFRESIKRAMKYCHEHEGITCRPMTASETHKYDQNLPDPERATKPLPFSERVEQVSRVRSLAKENSITIVSACEVVGISFSNYKSVLAALKKGATKRP